MRFLISGIVLWFCAVAYAAYTLWFVRKMKRSYLEIFKLKDEIIAIQRAELERLWLGKKMPDTFWNQKGNSN